MHMTYYFAAQWRLRGMSDEKGHEDIFIQIKPRLLNDIPVIKTTSNFTENSSLNEMISYSKNYIVSMKNPL